MSVTNLFKAKQNSNILYISAITLTATLGGLLFGYDTAVISGAVGSLKSFFITPLLNDPDAAVKVITQFKVIGLVSFAFVLTLILSFLKRMFTNGRKLIIYSGIATLFITLTVYYLFLRHGNKLDESLINVIHGFNISSALIGCIIGGSLAGYISQNIGRKNGLAIAALLFLLSAIGSAMPDKMNIFGGEVLGMFMVYRVLGGIGV